MLKNYVKPEVLRKANQAEQLLYAHSAEAVRSVETLSAQTIEFQFQQGSRKRKFKADVLSRFKSTLAALLGDLLYAQSTKDAEGFCWRRSNRTSFSSTLAESRHYESIKSSWRDLGYLEVVDGFRGNDDWEGKNYYPGSQSTKWATRLRATPKLLQYLAEFGIRADNVNYHFKRSLGRSQPIHLKSSKNQTTGKNKRIELPQSPKLRALEEEVNRINAFLSDQDFSFGPAPYLYRVFNNGDSPDFNWNYGGRFYASGENNFIQNKEYRQGLKINGSPAISLDITACQLTLLHGLIGFDLDADEDPYHIDSVSRDDVKVQVNIIIGRGVVSEPETETKNIKARRIETEVVQRFPVLKYMRSHGWESLGLQAVESNIMTKTLLRLQNKHSIPALPVHDCLIVSEQDADRAEAVFSEVFVNQADIKPKIKREALDDLEL